MNSLEKKAVQHISKSIKAIDDDWYQFYSLFQKALEADSPPERLALTRKYEELMNVFGPRLRDARDWADTLLEDQK